MAANKVPAYRQVRLADWRDAANLAGRLQDKWVCRGHSDAEWKLTTTLQRAGGWPKRRRTFARLEETILETFLQRAHAHMREADVPVPEDADKLDWLALIQHYGGPTRLLDFTESFYVAVFFALERRACETYHGDAAVWAVQRDRLLNAANKKLEGSKVSDPKTRGNASIGSKVKQQPLAFPMMPERISVRMAAQQGIFLCPLDIARTFEQNLFGTFGLDPNVQGDTRTQDFNVSSNIFTRTELRAILKIILPPQVHSAAFKSLRGMNINASSLFPGLDGLARSLFGILR